MDVDPRSRGTGNTLVGPGNRGLSVEGVALDQFIELLRKGPANDRVAPNTITLPDSLCGALRGAATAAYTDGLEHGGVFGYFAGEPVKFGMLYTAGTESEIRYPAPGTWPALRSLGRFHTHLRVSDGLGGWAGGGPSGTDLTNFLVNDGHASIVFAQTKSGSWKLYFLLRPQESHLPGGPAKVGKDYEQRVMAAVKKGADPIDATHAELKALAQLGAFVFYSAIDTGFEPAGRPRTGSVALTRQS